MRNSTKCMLAIMVMSTGCLWSVGNDFCICLNASLLGPGASSFMVACETHLESFFFFKCWISRSEIPGQGLGIHASLKADFKRWFQWAAKIENLCSGLKVCRMASMRSSPPSLVFYSGLVLLAEQNYK